MRQLILGSSSRYRQALLARLGLPFETAVPAISEDAHSGETPDALAARLAASKARAISRSGALVIGSDQVAANDAGILRKPGDFTQALKQLLACQGRPVDFHTAVYLYDQASEQSWSHLDRTTVHFLERSQQQIEYYLRLEQPFDCAGGFKVEGVGIALFDRIESQDPTALIGLPLIALVRLLRQAGLDPLSGAR
jgi:septum formation protein